MKSLVLIVLCTCFSLANAQHYLIPEIQLGQNPGNLNNDDEQPSLYMTSNYSGYTEILTSGSSGWTGSQTLPFNFNFDDSTYSSYHVESSGLLTFSTPDTAIGDVNTDLPNPALPDNTVCVWGLNLSGTNDGVITKTFGTAPNRQHWVIWASATDAGMLGDHWTYWAIVLEESTDNIYVVDQRTYTLISGENTSLTVGIQYDSSSAISAPLSPSVPSFVISNNYSWSSSDNVYYQFSPGQIPTVDLALIDVQFPAYFDVSDQPKYTIMNFGAPFSGSTDLTWQSGSISATASVNISLGTGDTIQILHPDSLAVPAGTHEVQFSITTAEDSNAFNDSTSGVYHQPLFIPNKGVVIEEWSGAWCGWCPRGYVNRDTLKARYPETFIPIVSQDDVMEVTEYEQGLLQFVDALPEGTVDRAYSDLDPSIYEDYYLERMETFAVASIESAFELDTADYSMEIDISAKFAIDVIDTTDYRLAAILVEDSVNGPSPFYDQYNYYAGGAYGPMGGYDTLPNPIPGEQMYYMHVARQLFGGFNGEAGSVPLLTAGDTASISFSGTFDSASFRKEHCYVVAMLIEQSTGHIRNAIATPLHYDVPTPEGVEENSMTQEWLVFPNPSRDYCILKSMGDIVGSTVYVMSVDGSIVKSMRVGSNYQFLNLTDLPSGIYSLVLENGKTVSSKRLSIIR